jgi:hypothetical protein
MHNFFYRLFGLVPRGFSLRFCFPWFYSFMQRYFRKIFSLLFLSRIQFNPNFAFFHMIPVNNLFVFLIFNYPHFILSLMIVLLFKLRKLAFVTSTNLSEMVISNSIFKFKSSWKTNTPKNGLDLFDKFWRVKWVFFFFSRIIIRIYFLPVIRKSWKFSESETDLKLVSNSFNTFVFYFYFFVLLDVKFFLESKNKPFRK